MARTNLKKVQEAINMAAEAAVKQLASERKIDVTHLEEHAQASRDRIDQIARQEAHIIDYLEKGHTALTDGLRKMFGDMRSEEQDRLTSLLNHIKDINDDGDNLIEQSNIKRLNGMK